MGECSTQAISLGSVGRRRARKGRSEWNRRGRQTLNPNPRRNKATGGDNTSRQYASQQFHHETARVANLERRD